MNENAKRRKKTWKAVSPIKFQPTLPNLAGLRKPLCMGVLGSGSIPSSVIRLSVISEYVELGLRLGSWKFRFPSKNTCAGCSSIIKGAWLERSAAGETSSSATSPIYLTPLCTMATTISIAPLTRGNYQKQVDPKVVPVSKKYISAKVFGGFSRQDTLHWIWRRHERDLWMEGMESSCSWAYSPWGDGSRLWEGGSVALEPLKPLAFTGPGFEASQNCV